MNEDDCFVHDMYVIITIFFLTNFLVVLNEWSEYEAESWPETIYISYNTEKKTTIKFEKDAP